MTPSDVRVIATTVNGTRAALGIAVPLARGNSARLVVTVPSAGSGPMRDSVADPAAFLVKRYREIAADFGGEALVEVCICRSTHELLAHIDDDAIVVIGGRTGGWLMSRDERLARRVARHVRRVIFVAAESSRERRRHALPIAAVAAATITLSGGVAHAQQPAGDQLLRRIEALELEIAALKAEVKQLSNPAQVQDPSHGPALPVGGEKRRADDSGELMFGIGLDTYYALNFNHPIGRVNLLRAYDVTSNNFSLNQASVIVASDPDLDRGRRFGGRLDLQYGQATETLQGSLANEPRPWVYRNIFQAYGTFVAPVGSGLRIDFGKWASALGIEGNYSKDQINYSRSYLFDFLPFYHMGARVSYRVAHAVTLNYWITNGTQQTESFNDFKDQLAGVTLQPAKTVTWNVQYYLGQEHPDVQTASTQAPGRPESAIPPGLSITPVSPFFRGKLHIFDTYATWQVTPATTVAAEADYVVSDNPAPSPRSRVTAGAAYFRRQLTANAAIGARAEYLADTRGLFSGRAQRLSSATLTWDYRLADGFLFRSEYRRDGSDVAFFLTSRPGVLEESQHTATLGLIWWWGTKRDAW